MPSKTTKSIMPFDLFIASVTWSFCRMRAQPVSVAKRKAREVVNEESRRRFDVQRDYEKRMMVVET